MLADQNITGLIDELYNTLSGAISYGDNKSDHPELLAELLEATYSFSGFKTYHQMNEVGLILESKESYILTFDQFKEQTAKIDSKYNETYLQTEYQFFSESARMANKWADIEADGDRYDLQYRTAGDDKVREEHRALEGTTLPPSDPFWDRYFPPNGYNCFVAGTKVRTVNGWTKIEKITKSDLVIGGSGDFKPVIGIHAKPFNGEIITLTSKRKRTSCTPNHRFITKKGWIAADDIKPGDIILQVAKAGFFDKCINAVHNTNTIFRYFVMSMQRKWKTIDSSAFNNKSL